MSEKNGRGGPQSFEDACRGLRKRKATGKRRNRQIRDLKKENISLREKINAWRALDIENPKDFVEAAGKLSITIKDAEQSDGLMSLDCWTAGSILKAVEAFDAAKKGEGKGE